MKGDTCPKDDESIKNIENLNLKLSDFNQTCRKRMGRKKRSPIESEDS